MTAPTYWRDVNLLRKYGVTPEAYAEMLAEQAGGCAACSRTNEDGKPLAVDHDHKTGRVRALLCRKCNLALGFVDDSAEGLAMLIQYLGRFV